MLKIAIIGAGAISTAHIEAYRQFPERCEIVAVADIYKNKAENRIAEQQLLNAQAYEDYKKLLNKDIDLISVCTPPYTHAEISISFLQAGKHVIVEKPMASSLEECDAMNEAAKASGKLLSVIAQNRFRTPMMKLKSVLESGLIGPVVHTQVDSFWWRGHCYYDLWWRGTWEMEGGGCTLNHAVHHIDALLWMKGQPTELQAVMGNTAHDNAEVEDLSIAILKFADGSLGQITSSVVHHGEKQQLIFQGKNARISAPWLLTASSALENGFPTPNSQLTSEIQAYYEKLPEVIYEGHVGQVDNVLSAIENGASLLIDGYSGRATLELILAIYKAATTGEKVKFPLHADDPFYTRKGIQENIPHFYEKTASVANFSDQAITTGSSLE